MNPSQNTDPRGASSTDSSTPSSAALQRGKACLSCRRRKMKCDGLRPVCTPCLRGERVEDCEYTDGHRRPRTLALEEDVARLRARLQELEHPEEAIPSVELYAPYPTTGPSSIGSTSQTQLRGPALAAYPHAGPVRQAPTRGQSSGDVVDPRRLDANVEVHGRRALSVIEPYAAEIGFFLNLDRLRAQGTSILPALHSALTLWSAFISSCANESDRNRRVDPTQTPFPTLLSQTQTQLAASLSNADAEPNATAFIHVLQTGVLLSNFMQRLGQVVGARYYASGTWSLGVTMKLHQNPYALIGARGRDGRSVRPHRAYDRASERTAPSSAFAYAGCAELAPPLDEIEAEERVRAFWTIYALDRWFSAMGQGPPQSPVMDGSAVSVPWPDDDGMDEARNVIRDLLHDPRHDFAHEGLLAMHAKASVLLGEATAISASYLVDRAVSQSTAFRTRFATLDGHLQRCLNVAMAMATEQQPQSPEQRLALVTLHIVAFAYVTLHRPFISTYIPSGRRCTEAALSIVRMLDLLDELGTRVGVSPVYGVVWTALCLVLHQEILSLRARPNPDASRRREQDEIAGVIRRLVATLSALSQGCPSRFFAIKIEAVLPILESLSI